ncbi:hypothetical protein [Mycobacterium tuberculosis]|uniref:hypothetical protein n=1 Tax=Mycobacterium tuberculosis TaxID=1773 RepID=UPI003D7C30C8
MTAAAAPYVAWMSVTAVRAEQAGSTGGGCRCSVRSRVRSTRCPRRSSRPTAPSSWR